MCHWTRGWDVTLLPQTLSDPTPTAESCLQPSLIPGASSQSPAVPETHMSLDPWIGCRPCCSRLPVVQHQLTSPACSLPTHLAASSRSPAVLDTDVSLDPWMGCHPAAPDFQWFVTTNCRVQPAALLECPGASSQSPAVLDTDVSLDPWMGCRPCRSRLPVAQHLTSPACIVPYIPGASS